MQERKAAMAPAPIRDRSSRRSCNVITLEIFPRPDEPGATSCAPPLREPISTRSALRLARCMEKKRATENCKVTIVSSAC